MLRVLFAGSPECAVPALEELASRHRIVAVLTNPPAPAGRSGEPIPTPVALAARRLMDEGLIARDAPILTPDKINDDVRASILAQEPDCMACFAFGKIFGPKTLALFPKGAYNVHPSLLPRWRGCAPIPATILAGDAETGVTVQRMALEMDSGDILAQTRFPLDGTEYASELLERAAREGAQLIARVLDEVEQGCERGTPQDSSQATFCTMLKKEDGLIDWNSDARAVSATIRAFHPWPGAYTLARAGAQDGTESTLIVHRAHVVPETPRTQAMPGTVLGVDKKEGILVQTGDGVLALETLQWRTKKILDWKSFINGSRDFVGSVLGNKGHST